MLPPALAALIQAAAHADLRFENDLPAKVAKQHGGIALYGDIGGMVLLRPDGSMWEVAWDAEDAALPVAAKDRTRALVAGLDRYPWLGELLPKVRADARICSDCHGEGRLHLELPRRGGGILCPSCDALGWRPADRDAPRSALARLLSGR